MLVLTRTEGESIIIDDNIKITILQLGRGKVKLGLEAPKGILIHREELYKAIQREKQSGNVEKS